MIPILPLISWLALAAVVLPAVLVFQRTLDLASAQRWMLLATLCWFVVTPFWMNRRDR